MDQSSTPTPTPTPEPTTNEAPPAAPTPTPPVAPETYTFKAPAGQTANPELVAAANPIFKELNLTQAQADKLVDLYNKTAVSDADRALAVIRAQNDKWSAELKSDPFLGPRADEHRVTVARALDQVLTADERASFAQAMDLTGAGNNPAFARAFVKLAERVAPGTHVSGTSPVPVTRPGTSSRPSIAEAMFPNLAAKTS